MDSLAIHLAVVSEIFCVRFLLLSCRRSVPLFDFISTFRLFLLSRRKSKAEPAHPCQPTPCGTNAVCQEYNGAGACSCIPEYYGDPYIECRPECILNSECPSNRACINNKCVDPCPGTCGYNAECQIVNHSPLCTCYAGYVGNPMTGCHQPPSTFKFHYFEKILTRN